MIPLHNVNQERQKQQKPQDHGSRLRHMFSASYRKMRVRSQWPYRRCEAG